MSRVAPAASLAVLAFAAVVIVTHAGLLPIGYWQPDEFHNFGLYREHGWGWLWERTVTWSPRPLSEAAIALYRLAVDAVGRPLIVPALATLWALLACSVAPFVFRNGQRLARAALASALLALFLLGHRVSEVFYWPISAAAYVLTLAGATALVLEIVDGRWRGLSVAFLLVAGLSSEVGALFAACLAATMLLLAATRRIGRAWLWLVPLVCACIVLALLAIGRGNTVENAVYLGLGPNPALLRHPLASVARAIPTFARDLAVLDNLRPGQSSIAIGLALKTAILLGMVLCLRRLYPQPRDIAGLLVLWALFLSLVGTIFISIAGSYDRFGLPCCERHETLRQCLFLLAELVAAALIASALARHRIPSWSMPAGMATIAGVMLILAIRRLPDLAATYRAEPVIARLQRENWASGTTRSDRMTIQVAPPTPLIAGMALSGDGLYAMRDHPPWFLELIMTFFHKREIVVLPPDRVASAISRR